MECTYIAISINVIFQSHINLSSPLAPLCGEIDICTHGLFWRKLNSEQLLFEGFLAVMRIFGSIIKSNRMTKPLGFNRCDKTTGLIIHMWIF